MKLKLNQNFNFPELERIKDPELKLALSELFREIKTSIKNIYDDFGAFPTIVSGDAGKKLQVNTLEEGYEAVADSSDSIADADGDTKIQVEESTDEDKIRFDTAGTERMVIDGKLIGVHGTPSGNVGQGLEVAGAIWPDNATDKVIPTNYLGLSAKQGVNIVRGSGAQTIKDKIDFGGLFFIQGYRNDISSTTNFADVIVCYYSTGVHVMASVGAGGPPTRTYTRNSQTLYLSLDGSGQTYNVSVIGLCRDQGS